MHILDKIAISKKLEIEELKIELPLESFIDKIPMKKTHVFKDALKDSSKINIIAEIKKGSPSKGIIREDFDPGKLASDYKRGGAAALSVLTEQKYFYGSFENLKVAREVSSLPVLCKDFIIDPYQVYHAAYIGTDAILLIVRLLPEDRINELIDVADEVGVDVLLEVHDEAELKIALNTEAEIIGVNNRDLNNFEVSLNTAVNLGKLIPGDKIKVAESGIFGFDDIMMLQKAGYNNFLIGEALVKRDNPVELLKTLMGL